MGQRYTVDVISSMMVNNADAKAREYFVIVGAPSITHYKFCFGPYDTKKAATEHADVRSAFDYINHYFGYTIRSDDTIHIDGVLVTKDELLLRGAAAPRRGY